MSSPPAELDASSPDFLQSLARGLRVIEVFSNEHPRLTLSELARLTGLTRATARRILLTLEALGLVRNDNREFSLTPRVLELGYAYLSSLDLTAIAQPEMERLVERLQESSSAAVLDGTDIVYVVRVPTKRIMTISLGLGSRLPAHATSMGRVLLADLTPPALDAYFAQADLVAHTDLTVTDEQELRDILDASRRSGWAIVDQELEDGVRSVAAPIRNTTGNAVAALNVSGHAGRVSLDTMEHEFLPALIEAADTVSDRLAKR